MIIITLSKCPPALRGDLTLWLAEIDTGVFVGRLSARVREQLWQRIIQNAKEGRALMVYTARNEQGMDFRIHQGGWQPIDFDGLKLMMRPAPSSPPRSGSQQKPGYSQAARFEQARRMAGGKRKYALPERFCVVDVETTGLNPGSDQIIELAAIRVQDGQAVARHQSLVQISGKLPPDITALTGISDQLLRQEGQPQKEALAAFLTFIQHDHLVSHQTAFDYGFLQAACKRAGLIPLSNPCTDTLPLARRLLRKAKDYRLGTLAAHLDIKTETFHRGMADCETTLSLFIKLIEIGNQSG